MKVTLAPKAEDRERLELRFTIEPDALRQDGGVSGVLAQVRALLTDWVNADRRASRSWQEIAAEAFGEALANAERARRRADSEG